MSTHAWSLTLRSSTEVSFGHETLSFMTKTGWIRSLRRKSRPRETEMVKIEFCGPKRVHDRDMVIFQFRIFLFNHKVVRVLSGVLNSEKFYKLSSSSRSVFCVKAVAKPLEEIRPPKFQRLRNRTPHGCHKKIHKQTHNNVTDIRCFVTPKTHTLCSYICNFPGILFFGLFYTG